MPVARVKSRRCASTESLLLCIYRYGSGESGSDHQSGRQSAVRWSVGRVARGTSQGPLYARKRREARSSPRPLARPPSDQPGKPSSCREFTRDPRSHARPGLSSFHLTRRSISSKARPAQKSRLSLLPRFDNTKVTFVFTIRIIKMVPGNLL